MAVLRWRRTWKPLNGRAPWPENLKIQHTQLQQRIVASSGLKVLATQLHIMKTEVHGLCTVLVEGIYGLGGGDEVSRQTFIRFAIYDSAFSITLPTAECRVQSAECRQQTADSRVQTASSLNHSRRPVVSEGTWIDQSTVPDCTPLPFSRLQYNKRPPWLACCRQPDSAIPGSAQEQLRPISPGEDDTGAGVRAERWREQRAAYFADWSWTIRLELGHETPLQCMGSGGLHMRGRVPDVHSSTAIPHMDHTWISGGDDGDGRGGGGGGASPMLTSTLPCSSVPDLQGQDTCWTPVHHNLRHGLAVCSLSTTTQRGSLLHHTAFKAVLRVETTVSAGTITVITPPAASGTTLLVCEEQNFPGLEKEMLAVLLEGIERSQTGRIKLPWYANENDGGDCQSSTTHLQRSPVARHGKPAWIASQKESPTAALLFSNSDWVSRAWGPVAESSV
ncbi:hypothetical protein E2P81_ATG08748 [Venturia nashicola]|nr:hypothetical protein E2P81_ATG08748 [Venturia nashicola]